MFDRYGIDLRDAVAAVRGELPVAPLREDLIGPKASAIQTAARRLGYDWNPIDKLIYQDRCDSHHPMGFYGAPSFQAKWNARMWVDDAVAGVRSFTGAKVEQVVVEDAEARGVVYSAGGAAFVARGLPPSLTLVALAKRLASHLLTSEGHLQTARRTRASPPGTLRRLAHLGGEGEQRGLAPPRRVPTGKRRKGATSRRARRATSTASWVGVGIQPNT